MQVRRAIQLLNKHHTIISEPKSFRNKNYVKLILIVARNIWASSERTMMRLNAYENRGCLGELQGHLKLPVPMWKSGNMTKY